LRVFPDRVEVGRGVGGSPLPAGGRTVVQNILTRGGELAILMAADLAENARYSHGTPPAAPAVDLRHQARGLRPGLHVTSRLAARPQRRLI
jgi:hypothetical protein